MIGQNCDLPLIISFAGFEEHRDCERQAAEAQRTDESQTHKNWREPGTEEGKNVGQ